VCVHMACVCVCVSVCVLEGWSCVRACVRVCVCVTEVTRSVSNVFAFLVSFRSLYAYCSEVEVTAVTKVIPGYWPV
jgi:hypothetical protein